MKIGFCGLGLMGLPMVKRLLASGQPVMVWNRTPDKITTLSDQGVLLANTPQQLAEQCDVVVLCLFDASAVQDVVFGPQGLVHGTQMRFLVDHSSIPPASTVQMATRLQEMGNAVWIDAPVSGGVAGAESGTLAIMAGGPAQAIQQLTPLMMAYGQRVTRMGDVGAGQASKLCNQTIVATTIAAIAEAVALAESSGVDASQLSQALAGGWADSVLLQTFIPRMTATSSGKITATVNTMLKDLDTVAVQAQVTNVPMPVSCAAQQAYRQASKQGLGETDVSRLVQVPRGALPDSLNNS